MLSFYRKPLTGSHSAPLSSSRCKSRSSGQSEKERSLEGYAEAFVELPYIKDEDSALFMCRLWLAFPRRKALEKLIAYPL